jgi:hypothetical protein
VNERIYPRKQHFYDLITKLSTAINMNIYRRMFVFASVPMSMYILIWYTSLPIYNTSTRDHKTNTDSTKTEDSQIEVTQIVHSNSTTKVNQSPVSYSKTKIIFIWNRQPWLFSKFGSTKKDFKEAGCVVHNCRLVDRSSYAMKRVQNADCILFTIRDFFGEKPIRVSTDQIWVMWHNEAPLHDHPVSFSELNDYFNLTYSYMDTTETDIYSPASG